MADVGDDISGRFNDARAVMLSSEEADRLMAGLRQARQRGMTEGYIAELRRENPHPRDLLETVEALLAFWCGTPFQGREARRIERQRAEGIAHLKFGPFPGR